MALGLIQALDGIQLNSGRPDRLATFFIRALGFEPTSSGVSLGPSRVDLRRATGAPYPAGVGASDVRFQHFAILTGDMQAAFDQLRRVEGWTPITWGEPRTLPASSGGVTAFKFRDPEGHPLELLALPSGHPRSSAAPMIDHSAITVRDTARSVSFYRDLGFQLAAQSLNEGAEQDHLDGLPGACVEVTALIPPAHPVPHVELLAYRGTQTPADPAAVGDVAATVLLLRRRDDDPLEACNPSLAERGRERAHASAPSLVRDPDGHLLEIRAGEAR